MCPLNFNLFSFPWAYLMAYPKAKHKSTGDIASPSFIPFWRGIIHVHHMRARTHTHTHININFILLTTLSLCIGRILLSFTALVLNMRMVGWVTTVSYIPKNIVKNFVSSTMPQELCDVYTECPRRNGQNFGRVFLMLNYTDITQNTYIQSWTVMEIMPIEKCGLLGCTRTVCRPWCHTHPLRMPGNEKPLANIGMQWPWRDKRSAAACVRCLVTLRTTMTWVRVFL